MGGVVSIETNESSQYSPAAVTLLHKHIDHKLHLAAVQHSINERSRQLQLQVPVDNALLDAARDMLTDSTAADGQGHSEYPKLSNLSTTTLKSEVLPVTVPSDVAVPSAPVDTKAPEIANDDSSDRTSEGYGTSAFGTEDSWDRIISGSRYALEMRVRHPNGWYVLSPSNSSNSSNSSATGSDGEEESKHANEHDEHDAVRATAVNVIGQHDPLLTTGHSIAQHHTPAQEDAWKSVRTTHQWYGAGGGRDTLSARITTAIFHSLVRNDILHHCPEFDPDGHRDQPNTKRAKGEQAPLCPKYECDWGVSTEQYRNSEFASIIQKSFDPSMFFQLTRAYMYQNGAYADKLSQMPYDLSSTVNAQSLTTFGQDTLALQSQVDNVMMNAARGQLYNMWEFVEMLNDRQFTNAPHHQHLQQQGERWQPSTEFYWIPCTRWPHPMVIQKDCEVQHRHVQSPGSQPCHYLRPSPSWRVGQWIRHPHG
jgi:hypothetical protein